MENKIIMVEKIENYIKVKDIVMRKNFLYCKYIKYKLAWFNAKKVIADGSIKYILEHYDVNPEVVAFGGERNDYDMALFRHQVAIEDTYMSTKMKIYLIAKIVKTV